MKKIVAIGLVMIAFASFAQKDPIVMKVDGKNVTKSEFEHIFKKNNTDTDITKDDIDEYLELFTNFKLKVTEAENLGLDTVQKFTRELNQYREQLAKPYLVDQEVTDQLMKEGYDRMKFEVNASHILINCKPGSSPEDTLKAYKTIEKAINEIQSGSDFAVVAKKYSNDPSAKDNAGNLGYFSAFKMVYPFETAAFETPVGELSRIVRTSFGYHIVKVHDKREARGTRLAAHILIKADPKDSKEILMEAEKKANEIYNQIKSGGNFEQLAQQHSDDKSSAPNGGKLKWFGAGDLIPAFDKALFDLKADNDISAPTKTRFGYHIIKRLESKEIETFDESKNFIKSKISKDGRASKSKASFINKLKAEYDYKMIQKSLDKFIATLADSNILEGKHTHDSNAKINKKKLFSFKSKQYTVGDFSKYLENSFRKPITKDVNALVNNNFKTYVNSEIMNYEKSILESKHEQYRLLMKEYRDGILLFELTDKMVWTKAVKDTSGLKEFYNENSAKFIWKERVDADFMYCQDSKVAEKVKAMFGQGIALDSIRDNVNKESRLNLNMRSKKEEIENLTYISGDLKKGINGPYDYNGQQVLINVKEVIAEAPKKLKEAKGLITASYQDHLEAQWLKDLNAKYKVEVFKEVLYTVK